MKSIIGLLLILGSSVLANDQSCWQVITVTDKNNELVTSAKVELIGSGKVYYTNTRGECYVPMIIYKQCKTVKIECVSYKSAQLTTAELSSKVVLEFR